MAEEKQVLRQGLNKVEVIGFAKSSTLAKGTFNDKKTGQPYNAISGDVTVQINDEESHTLSYFEKELTKKGAENKNYKSLTTAMSKLITVADVAQGLAEGEPSRIECQGEIELNEFKGSDGEIISFPRIKGKFSPQSFKGKIEEFEPKATFDIEGIVKTNKPEMDSDENETGRMKIVLYVPVYGGKVSPLTFITNANLTQQGKDYVSEHFVSRASIRIYGDMVNTSKKIVRVLEAGFGENKEDITYENTREFITNGGTLYEEGVHKETFDVSLLQEAVANRNRFLATLKEEVKEDKPKAGFGQESHVPNATPSTPPKDDGLDDLFGED